jgi:inorganic triphosphatase YgiF
LAKKTERRDGGATRDADHGHDPATIPAIDASEEFELKLEVDPADLEALLAAPPFDDPAARERAQQSVYFDTPGRLLHEAGFSLRVRTIGDAHIQTVKAESAATAGLFVRPEWEHAIDTPAPVLDGGETPFGGLVPDSELARIEPVFRVDVTRRTLLIARDGAQVEAVLDRGAVQAGDRSDPVHEIELELKSGHPTTLFDLAREFDGIAPVRLGVLTKSERGYRLGAATLDKPVKTAALNLPDSLSTAAGFQAVVGACLRQFRLNETILLRSGHAGALHQARVALRRLRSALSTFKPVVEDDRYDHVRTELRWIAGELGRARNLDVLIERVRGKKATRPLLLAREQAYGAVDGALASARLRGLMLDLVEWAAIGPWITDRDRADIREQPIAAFAAKALDKHRRRLKRLGAKLDEVDDETRHEARIEAKKLRYATEFFASLFPGKKAARRSAAFHDALATLQSHLGDLNDLATAPLVLAELELTGTATAAALQPDLSRREPLLKQAAEAHAVLMDAKRFWR